MNSEADQLFEIIPVQALLEKVGEMRKQAYRLVQISATRLPDQLELTYSFDLDGRLVNFRLHIPDSNLRVPSISSIYWCAFLYENEIHDLFGISFDGLALDFKGHLYQTAIPFPFSQAQAPTTPPSKPAPAAAVSATPKPSA